MQTIPPEENITFWNRIAPFYDIIIDCVTKDYSCLIKMVAKTTQESRRVLDVATGTGRTAVELSLYCEMVDAIDLSPQMIQTAWKKAIRQRIQNLAFSVQNIYRLEYEAQLFDSVVCCNTLFCLKAPHLALKELHRVLKPDGLLVAPTYCHGQHFGARIVSTPLMLSGMKLYHRFNDQSLARLIETNGFRILENQLLNDVIPLAYLTAIRI